MKQIGKKGQEWAKTRAKLKVVFERLGITSCELRYAGCWGAIGLGFAHLKKRRFITTQEDLEKVVLSCNICHNIVEFLPAEEMKKILQKVINTRNDKNEFGWEDF